jgi:2-hydroxychromene-2-carboxylate isomerase
MAQADARVSVTAPSYAGCGRTSLVPRPPVATISRDVAPLRGRARARAGRAHVSLALPGEGWTAPFCRAVLAANFAEDLDISDPTVLDAILARLGLDGPAIRALAESPAWKPKLREETERAVARGIFGAPFFVVQGELFWGNDRLEQALAWARRID